MTILQTPRAAGIRKVEWVHRLFVRGNYAISCDVDVRGDGTCVVTLFPLWSPEDQVTEMFLRPAEAMRWHVELTRRLQSSGWLLLEGGAVTSAA